MSEWKEVKLKDVGCKFLSGYAFKSEDYSNTGIPLIKIGNIQNKVVSVDINGTFVNADLITNKLSKYLLCNEDILIAMTGQGSVGRVGKLHLANNQQALLNQRVGKFITTNSEININFLYYVLSSSTYQEYLFNTGSGSGQPNLSPDLILETEVVLPPVPEQERIAEVLSSLDDKIDLLHRNNNILEQLAETLFRQWFVEQSNENWDVLKFHELVKHVKPGTNFQPKRVLSGIPFLNVKNLDNGFLNYSDINYITPEEYKRVHKNWIPEANDILISRIGTLGIVAAITERDLPVAVHYNMINLKSKRTSFQFLYFLLKSNMFQEKYESIIRQSVQEYVAIEDVENIELRLPINHSLFQEKEKSLIELFNKVKANYSQIKYLEKLRNTLLPKLMSGTVRVEN